MKVQIVMPWRAGNPHRDRSYPFVLAWWKRFDYPVEVVEQPGPEPFNRSGAINEGARRTWPWDVLLTVDSDSIEDRDEQVPQAVELAQGTGRLVVAHHGSKNLSLQGSRAILGGKKVRWESHVEKYMPITNSRVNAIRADLFEEVGGFDERFRGWGCADGGFIRSCIALRGELERVPGHCWHFWHPLMWRTVRATPEYRANRALGNRYIEAFRGEGWSAIKEILDERTEDQQWRVPSLQPI